MDFRQTGCQTPETYLLVRRAGLAGTRETKRRHFAEVSDVFLRETLDLALHPNKVHVRTWGQGVDFLGYVLLPKATILRPKTAKRVMRRVTSRNKTSYLGLCAHADAHAHVRAIR